MSKNHIDIDSSWDGKGSLDDHRMKILETLEQPGFGIHAKPKTDSKPVVAEEIPVDAEKGDGDGE